MDSRIPEKIEFGSPKEDSLRRDLTINSLFYNIIEDKVEDFTEMGLNDLKSEIIRTPLAAFETFNDDPLRVLRVFRFAAKYGFEIHESISEAIKNEKI